MNNSPAALPEKGPLFPALKNRYLRYVYQGHWRCQCFGHALAFCFTYLFFIAFFALPFAMPIYLDENMHMVKLCIQLLYLFFPLVTLGILGNILLALRKNPGPTFRMVATTCNFTFFILCWLNNILLLIGLQMYNSSTFSQIKFLFFRFLAMHLHTLFLFFNPI